jgi:hypothetical protein
MNVNNKIAVSASRPLICLAHRSFYPALRINFYIRLGIKFITYEQDFVSDKNVCESFPGITIRKLGFTIQIKICSSIVAAGRGADNF